MGSKKWVDYYSILGIDREASEDDIKKAYRRLMQKFHPDLYTSSSEEEQEEAEEKAKDINEAYEILGNKEKKNIYDGEWGARANGTYRDEDDYYEDQEYQAPDVDYEDVKEYYTEEERRYAEKLSLKKIIEEELEKAEQIIRLKNEVIYTGYMENLEKMEYLDSVREFMDLAREYISSLNNLKTKTYEYDLLQEKAVIEETIEFLEAEMEDMPLTPKDAEMRCRKEELVDGIKSKIESQISKKSAVIEKLKMLAILAYQKEILPFDYTAYLEPILLEATSCVSELEELAKVGLKLGLKEEVETVKSALSELSAKIAMTPRTYEEAKTFGYVENLKERMTTLLNSWTIAKDKIDRISKLLTKYPSSSLYDRLYDYCLKLFKETDENLRKICREAQKREKIHIDKERLASEYSAQATRIYDKAEDLHSKAQTIYESREEYTKKYDNGTLNYLMESSMALWDKDAAFELLLEAERVLVALKSGEIQDKEFETIYENLINALGDIKLQREAFEGRHILERNENPYKGFKEHDFITKLNELKLQIKTNIIVGIPTTLLSFYVNAELCNSLVKSSSVGIKFIKILGIIFLSCAFAGGLTCLSRAYKDFHTISDLQTKYLEYLARKNTKSKNI